MEEHFLLNRKLIIVAIFLVSLLAVSAVSANETNATDEAVIGEDNAINEVSADVLQEDILSEADDGTFTALQKKIDDAQEGATITLENDYTYDRGSDAGYVLITKDLTINGNNHILDGSDKSRILSIQSGSVTLNNIKFHNGHGGAVGASVNSGDIIINNCEFEDNSAIESDGGAILCYNKLIVKNSVFINNVATYDARTDLQGNGGAIYCYSDTEIDNCTFTNNSGDHGIIYSYNKLSVKNSMFQGSYGSVYARNDLSVVNSNFENVDITYYYNGNLDKFDGSLYLENNTMGEWDQIWIEDINKIDFKVHLIFINQTVKSGDSIDVCTLEDDNGNKIKFVNEEIDVKIKKEGTNELIYDGSISGRYCRLNTESLLSQGNYEITGSLSFIDNYDVIPAKLTVRNNELITSNVTKFYHGNERYEVILIDGGGNPISDADINITLIGETFTVHTNSNGQASLDLDLPAGTYDVVSDYNGVNAASKITVKSTVDVSDAAEPYSNPKIGAKFLDTDGNALDSQQVTFKINDKVYTATSDDNGIATAYVDLDVGNYTVTAVNPVSEEEKQFHLMIYKANSQIALASSQINGVVTLTATLTPATAAGNVVFSVGNKTHSAPIRDGKATLTLNDLDAGNYVASASFNGDGNLNPSASDNVSFTVLEVYPILTADDVTKTYGDEANLVVNLVDNKGNAIANANVNVNITNQITPLTTDAQGRAFMPIDLVPGTYDVAVTYRGTMDTAKITVSKATPEITAKNAKFKAKTKTKKLKMTLKSNGKPLNGVKVTLKVNGKKYKATTKKGKATFKITKLTKKGKYKATITYKGDNCYNKATKKVNINVK